MDLKDIFRNDKLLQFWPNSKQSAKERIASTVRFVLYACVLLFLLKGDSRVMVLGGLVLATLYVLTQAGLISEGRARPTERDGRMFRNVTMPTLDNPWGNRLMADDGDRSPAAYYPTVREEIQDVWDEIHPFARQKDAMRNFYTVPENDQSALAYASFGEPFTPMCRDTPSMCDPDKMFYGRGVERVQQRAGFGQGGNGKASGSA